MIIGVALERRDFFFFLLFGTFSGGSGSRLESVKTGARRRYVCTMSRMDERSERSSARTFTHVSLECCKIPRGLIQQRQHV